MNERWIVIPRWDGPDGFQHYKDRDPYWIKTYVRQIRDDAYMSLSLSQRGLLHDLRLLYAESNGQLSEHRLRHRLSTNKAETRHLRTHLETLNHAGFIRFSARRPVQKRKSKSNKDLASGKTTTKPRPGTCPVCGVKPPKGTSLATHLRNVHNQENPA